MLAGVGAAVGRGVGSGRRRDMDTALRYGKYGPGYVPRTAPRSRCVGRAPPGRGPEAGGARRGPLRRSSRCLDDCQSRGIISSSHRYLLMISD